MKKNEDIMVILNIYKREFYEDQIHAILRQTILPSEILVWQNESHVKFEISNKIRQLLDEKNIKIHHIHSKSKNFKFHGRFTLPLLSENKFIVVLDDDTIPGHLWFENCMNICQENNCIVTANGRLWDHNKEKQIGFEAPIQSQKEVDFGGHSWFFKKEHIHYMWREKAPTFDNGEDMHISAASKIHGNIKTIMPRQNSKDRSDWGDTTPEKGWDIHASWRKKGHGDERDNLFKSWIKKGWEVLR